MSEPVLAVGDYVRVWTVTGLMLVGEISRLPSQVDNCFVVIEDGTGLEHFIYGPPLRITRIPRDTVA